VGDGIHVVIHFGVTLDLTQVVARAVVPVERDAQAPDVALTNAKHRLLAEGLRSAVETARRRAETKIWGVILCETLKTFAVSSDRFEQVPPHQVSFGAPDPVGTSHLRPSEDTSGGDMAPRYAGRRTGMRDRLGEQSISEQGVRLRDFTGVDVGSAGESGAVDNELRLRASQQVEQRSETRVISLAARDWSEIAAPPSQFFRKCGTNVTRSSKKQDHIQSVV